jgi:alkylated DNA repair dioxygenase AlkB
MDLFSNTSKNNDLHLPDADIYYYKNFLNKAEADKFYNLFLKTLQWEQHNIKIFGKILPQPRLTALYADNNVSYSYSNLTLHPHAFTSELQDLQKRLHKVIGVNFTHCLANLYRNGTDSMGWHSDNEKELGKNPVIASLSFGTQRKFQLKHKNRKDLNYDLELEHGSLLLMKGTTQQLWKHQLPKTKKDIGPRINLTFRNIL